MGTTAAITLGMLAAAFGIIGTTVLMAARGPIWDDWILDARGVRATATVTGRRAVNVRARNPDAFEITWRAEDASGRSIEGMARSDARAEDQIAVEYDPQDPARSRRVGRSAMGSPALLFAHLALAALGLPVLAAGVIRARRRRALYRDGVAARATVVSSARTWIRSHGDPVHRVVLRYQTAQGDHTLTERTTLALPPGEVAWVLHDPQRPARALLA